MGVPTSSWFYKTPHGKRGPITECDLAMMFGSGQLAKDVHVWRHGMPDWTPASECVEYALVTSNLDSTPCKPLETPPRAFGRKALYSVSALVIAAAVVGWYADSDPRYSVNGDVTAGGERVGYGTVSFYPREKRGKSSYGAAVVDDRFSIPKQEGLPPGSYRVEVVGFRRTKAPISGRAGEGGEQTARLPITRISPASIQVPDDIRQILSVKCDVDVE